MACCWLCADEFDDEDDEDDEEDDELDDELDDDEDVEDDEDEHDDEECISDPAGQVGRVVAAAFAEPPVAVDDGVVGVMLFPAVNG